MVFTQKKTLYIVQKRERKQRSKKKNVSSTMASYLSETGRCRPRSEDVAVVVVVVVVGTCGIPISIALFSSDDDDDDT